MRQDIKKGVLLSLVVVLFAQVVLAVPVNDTNDDSFTQLFSSWGAGAAGMKINITNSMGATIINATQVGTSNAINAWLEYENHTIIKNASINGNIYEFNSVVPQGVYYIRSGGTTNASSFNMYCAGTGYVSFPLRKSNVDWLGYWDGAGDYTNRAGCQILGVVTENITGPAPPDTFSLQLFNNVTGVSIGTTTFFNLTGNLSFTYFNATDAGFCVTYTGNGTGTNCTTSGSGESTFFNTTATALITGTETVLASSYQALINMSAYQLFTNATISSFNATNSLITNTTTEGSLILKALNGSNNIEVVVAGNYTVNVSCVVPAPFGTVGCNATGIYDNLFKINASDALNGNAVTTFNVTATNNSIGESVVETTNGSAYIPLLQGYDWRFFIDATGYAYANVTTPANATTNFYEFSLLPQNSLFLYFYEQSTLNPIYDNVTVEFVNGNTSFSNTSNTGEMLEAGLDVGTWTITASSDLYESSQYFVTVTERSSQVLDVYLLNSTLTGETTITIKDADTGDVIQGATVTLQILVGGNWVTFDQKDSDLFGVTFFELEQGEEYQMIVEAEGYNTKTGTFVRTTSAYIVPLVSANTQNFNTYLNDFTFSTLPFIVSPNSTTFSITTSSPDGRLEWFSVTVSLNGTNYTSNVTGSPSGGTASQTLNLSGWSGYTVLAVYRVKSTSFEDPLEISRSWLIYELSSGNYTLNDFMVYYADNDNGLGQLGRVFLLTLVAVLGALAVGIFFGVDAAAIMVIVVFIVGGIYDWMNWGIVIVVVAAIAGTLITRRGV